MTRLYAQEKRTVNLLTVKLSVVLTVSLEYVNMRKVVKKGIPMELAIDGRGKTVTKLLNVSTDIQ